MYQFMNIDKAAELVKDITDNSCCAVCGKSDGTRMRYRCGHTSCESCVPATESCPYCPIPRDCSTFTAPSLDKPYTRRTRNAIQLLNVFQQQFHTDVYKRHRISEQLKIEKELFPKCIQAPVKYFNKRKSKGDPSGANKENTITVLPGEAVSYINKMENTNNNVRKWLSKYVERKPLADLNYTRSNLNNTQFQKLPQKCENTQNGSVSRLKRKRSYSKIYNDENKTSINDIPITKREHKNTVLKSQDSKQESSYLHKHKRDDIAGVTGTDDDMIVTDDCSPLEIDKDRKAWQAVLDAEQRAQSGSLAPKLTGDQTGAHVKVPFYKTSYLFEKCESCNEFYEKRHRETEHSPINVSITVESKSYTVTINVSKETNTNKEELITLKNSVGIQTDCNDSKSKNNEESEVYVKEATVTASSPFVRAASPVVASSSNSEHIFMGEANESSLSLIDKASLVIIPDSDSDDNIEGSTSLQTTAEVHTFLHDVNVLDDVEDLLEHSKRARRQPRGHTPTSTDSSEKENYDPNRMKKNNSKKKPVKK